LLLEHPNVYTFGRRGKQENLLWGESQLKEKGIAIHWVDRGGDVTYHGPGQLVGYPLLPLGSPHPQPLSPWERGARIPDTDYVGYVRKLEKTLIVALARLGLAAGQRSGLTGVWIQPDVHMPTLAREDRTKPAKIAAIGIKWMRGISSRLRLERQSDMEILGWDHRRGLQDRRLFHWLICSPSRLRWACQTGSDHGAGKIFGYEMKKKQALSL
jgi:lipoate-protein ligase B